MEETVALITKTLMLFVVNEWLHFKIITQYFYSYIYIYSHISLWTYMLIHANMF